MKFGLVLECNRLAAEMHMQEALSRRIAEVVEEMRREDQGVQPGSDMHMKPSDADLKGTTRYAFCGSSSSSI